MEDNRAINNNSIDRWDTLISLSSGVLTSTLDLLFVKDIDLANAHEWGKEQTEKFVQDIAHKTTGYKGDLTGAIRKLEDKYEIPADKLTKEFGGGAVHHLRDFSHHPTPVGLLFSILTQLTGRGYGTDTQGNFIMPPLSDVSIIGRSIPDKLYIGTITWALHMVSDMAGSSGTVAMNREGTGLPGPLMSLFKELSAIPGIKSMAGKTQVKSNLDTDPYTFSAKCSKLFNGTLLGGHDEKGKIIKGGGVKFDLRTELGTAHEALLNKQYLPVVLNEVIVRSFYSIRMLCEEIKEKEIIELDGIYMIDLKRVLPFRNKRLTHMLTISSTTFSVVDISTAAIKAAIKNKDNKAGFALDLFQGINYFGLGRFALSAISESHIAIGKLQEKLAIVADTEFGKLSMKALSVAKVGTPVGFLSAAISVYQEISDATKELEIAKENRLLIEESCKESIIIINKYQNDLNTLVESYLTSYMECFDTGLETMNQAIKTGDVDEFITGNALIQEFLGYDVKFNNQEEFNELMMSEDEIKF